MRRIALGLTTWRSELLAGALAELIPVLTAGYARHRHRHHCLRVGTIISSVDVWEWRGALAEALRTVDAFSQVIAISRAMAPAIDLLDEASIERAAQFAASQGELRLVIDAPAGKSGVCHPVRPGR